MSPQQPEDWREFKVALHAAVTALAEADDEAELLLAVGGEKEIQLCNYAGPRGTGERLLVAAPDPGADKVSDEELERRWGASRDSSYSADECAISSFPLTQEQATAMVSALAAAHVASPADVRVSSSDATGNGIAATCFARWAA